MIFEDNKYFTAANLHFFAASKAERDANRELEAIVRAIYNEAEHGNYTYKRNHIFQDNIDKLRSRGFQVKIIPDRQFEVSWREY